MLFVVVALYFLLACFLAWLALFPTGRALLSRHLSIAGRRIDGDFRRLKQHAGGRCVAASDMLRETASMARGNARRHARLLATAVALLCLPPLCAWLAGSRFVLDGFGLLSHESNEQIAQLLEGEQLVSPSQLPPMLFTSREVAAEHPMLATASRNWRLLDPDFTRRLLLVFRVMKEKHGYEMVILEGYRSPERQNLLASMGSQVTSAAAFQSYHQFGLAADCAFLRDGKLIISEKDPWAMHGYRLYGALAESVGLHWGGRWKMLDFGHTEMRVPGMTKN